eukprot:CAMPEP_0185256126 /NCGR_PEP_ID=MMETSP1359-20130426/5203_1 /TAXON_ID=552665 /ORGANISM="Bigelowiella longifila, Strain CCMP242" /LENGTH=158 /DNA_ID=CAMNT_0027840493 /DNA_START=65 /DNA_END=541 /DNA_ORIENTATION=-
MSKLIDKKAMVARRAKLKAKFDIEIGAGTFIHNDCQILALKGPIYIGSGNLIEEQVIIRNNTTTPMIIGDHNYIEVGARIESLKIGSRNKFECKCSVADGAEVGDDCIIGAAVEICSGDVVEDNFIIFGSKQERRMIKSKRNLSDVKAALAALKGMAG